MSGSVFPVGHRTAVGCTIPILSQASPLEGLPPSQDAFQEHAAHSAGCSALLTPTVCLGATYVVAYTYEYDGGRIEPTHCALIDAGLGDRSRQRRVCSRPPAGAGSARIGLVVGSRPGATADPGRFHQSRTTPPSGTRSCGDASLARCAPDTHPCRLRPCLA